MKSGLAADLSGVVGARHILDKDDLAGRSPGWNPDNLRAACLVRPRTTDEVAAVLRLCHERGQTVVPQAGLTGLVRGASTAPGDLILSMERMNAVREIDNANRTMTVEAGVTLQAAQEAADAAGLFLPLDLAARGSCTIGGNIATNAGGNRVIRYGMTRENILGLEAVLADGTVLSSMNRMIKNNAGYDLKHLFIGSEGTLGIVTLAVLRLREQPQSRLTALAALESFQAIASFLKHMDRSLGGGLSAFEVMWREFYEAVATVVRPHSPPLPFGHAYYVVVEFLGADEDADRARFEAALEQAFDAGLLADAVLASSSTQAREIWDIRDQSEHAESASGPTVTFDVSLPIGAMEDYVAKVQGELAAQGRRPGCFVFGHLGDGNLHFMVPAEPGSDTDRHAVEAVVYGHLESLRGSVSAEHGIGLEKKAWLGHSRTPEELAVMRTLKRALDPKGVLNPGKVFDT